MLFSSDITIYTIIEYLKNGKLSIENIAPIDIIQLVTICNISNTGLMKAIDRIKYLDHFDDDKKNISVKEVIITEETILRSVANVKQIIIEITEKCNLACYYCCFGELYDNEVIRNNNLNIEKCKNSLRQLVQLQKSEFNLSTKKDIAITFYGGEPLLNINGIKQIVSFMRQFVSESFNIQYYMTTNGTLLRNIAFFVENNFRITISLDGDINQNSYRSYNNGKSSFEQIYQNVLSIKNTYPTYFIENISFISVLHNKNDFFHLYKFFDLIGKIPLISSISIEGVKKSKTNEFKDIYRPLKISDDEILNIKSYFPAIYREKFQTDDHNNELLFSLNHKLGIWNWDLNKQGSTCFLFQNRIFLTVSGLIYPCEKIDRKFPFGTFNNDKIEYFIGEINRYYKDFSIKGKTICSDCFNKNNCSECYFMTHDLDCVKCKVDEKSFCKKASESIESKEKSILEY
jgi:uncharacterized protein